MPAIAPPPEASFSSGAPASKPARRRRGRVRLLFGALLVLWLGTAWWQMHKPLPQGVRVTSAWYPVRESTLTFIADITAADAYGHPIMSHAIFDEVLRVVSSAREFIVLDYFLFNGEGGSPDSSTQPLRPISSELRDALIARKKAVPGLRILFITDPINDVYGGAPSEDLARLRAAGIDVAVTDLDTLRDSNFLYSSLWRITLRWWLTASPGSGWLPNPLEPGPERVSAGAWARLLNFKANHRKVIIADDGRAGITGIVASANPHDASSAHSNVALELKGAVLKPLLLSEVAIARFSGWSGVIGAPEERAGEPTPVVADGGSAPDGARVQVLTEGAIRDAVLERIGGAVRGDAIDIAMFYLSDRAIIDALLAASRRGVAVRLILDPNKDAFGHTKSGIPNRPVASELLAASDGAIRVRWYRTHGEQFHSKMLMVYGRDRLWLTLGSANLTRRNLGDFNLEANVALEIARNSALAGQLLAYFDTLWRNRAPLGIEYTADADAYLDPSQLSYWSYRLMEASGLSTF
jgi:phosphatidylserine/phosphatidylglycerophosphate/cardiolipin synthase-like enzyme